MRWLPLFIILSLAGLVGVRLLHNNRGTRQLTWRLLILSYFTGLGVILFTPLSFDGTAVYVMPAGTGQVNLTQLDLLNVGFGQNIILTMPLGLLIKRAFPHASLLMVGLLGLMIGSSIEMTQHYLSIYWLINRSSDINDVLANGIGVALGGVVMAGVAHAFPRTPMKHALTTD